MSNIANQAMENALTGEKGYATVAFPLSGDAELSAMAGILEVLRSLGVLSQGNGKIVQRIGLWLASRGKEDADRFDMLVSIQQQAAQRAVVNPIPSCPPPYVSTSSGAGAFQSPLANAYPFSSVP